MLDGALEDFAFQLTDDELAMLRSQNATFSLQQDGGARCNPWVYMLNGLNMVAAVLKFLGEFLH